MGYRQWAYQWKNQDNDSGHNAARLELDAMLWQSEREQGTRRRYGRIFWTLWRWAPTPRQGANNGD